MIFATFFYSKTFEIFSAGLNLLVTWCPTEKIETRLLLFPERELTVASRQNKECGSEGRPTDVYTL